MENNSFWSILTLVLCGVLLYFTIRISREMRIVLNDNKDLTVQIDSLRMGLNELQGQLLNMDESVASVRQSIDSVGIAKADSVVEKTSASRSQATTKVVPAKSSASGSPVTDKQKKSAPAQTVTSSVSTPRMNVTRTERKAERIKVSAKYRMEDRYVLSEVVLPDYCGTEEGVITVNITINTVGKVTKARIVNTNTITDDDTLEAAKKAALKTNFSSFWENGSNYTQSGTITYTYTRM